MFPCRGCRGVFLNRRLRDYIQTIVNMSATALPFRCVPNNVHDKPGGKSIFRKLILCLKNLHRPPFLGSWQIQSPWEQTFRATTKHIFQRDSMGHVSKTIGWVEEERKKNQGTTLYAMPRQRPPSNSFFSFSCFLPQERGFRK